MVVMFVVAAEVAADLSPRIQVRAKVHQNDMNRG